MPDDLHYLELGSGRPLLLLHGPVGFDHTYFRPYLDPLAELTQLTYCDLRGNGRSSRPAEWEDLTHETWVEDVETLRCKLWEDRPIVLFGHSYGGFIALEYALRHADRLDGLILCGTGPAMDHLPEAIERVLGRSEKMPEPGRVRRAIETIAERPPHSDEELETILRELLPIYFARPEQVDTDGVVDRMTLCAAALKRSFYDLMQSYDLRGRLSEITVPTLILSGQQDWILPPEYGGDVLERQLPNARHHVFDACGHFPFIEETTSFNEIVRSWLEERYAQLAPR